MTEDGERKVFVVTQQLPRGRRLERAKMKAWSADDAIARLRATLGKVAESWDLTAEEV